MVAVTPHINSPNIGNYYIGRGYCSIKLSDDADYLDCGNVTMFEFLVKPTLLDHYSSRIGVRTKDYTVITELAATLTMSMEEFTARNVALAVLGTITDSPAGTVSIDVFGQPLLRGGFKFTGTNDVGPQWSAEFPLVQFSPNKAISMIGAGAAAWGTIDLQADVLKDPVSGLFGTFSATGFTESP